MTNDQKSGGELQAGDRVQYHPRGWTGVVTDPVNEDGIVYCRFEEVGQFGAAVRNLRLLSRTPSHGRVSDSEDGRLPAAPGLRGFAPEPAAQSQPKALFPDVDHLSARHLYEGVAGGWKDGRFGQAYDLIAEALKERGVIELRGHKLLIDIELEDGNHE